MDKREYKELSELVRRIGLSEGMPVVINPEIISPQKFVDEALRDGLPRDVLHRFLYALRRRRRGGAGHSLRPGRYDHGK